MSMREMLRTVSFSVLLGLCGCAQARVVMSDSYGGVVAMPSNTNSWPCYNRKHAEELMAQKCPQGYVIEQEGEVVTGQSTMVHTEGNQDSAAYRVLGVGHVDRTTNVQNVTEWRIHFRAKDAPASVPPLSFTPPGQQPPPAIIPFASTPSSPGLPTEPVRVGQ